MTEHVRTRGTLVSEATVTESPATVALTRARLVVLTDLTTAPLAQLRTAGQRAAVAMATDEARA